MHLAPAERLILRALQERAGIDSAVTLRCLTGSPPTALALSDTARSCGVPRQRVVDVLHRAAGF